MSSLKNLKLESEKLKLRQQRIKAVRKQENIRAAKVRQEYQQRLAFIRDQVVDRMKQEWLNKKNERIQLSQNQLLDIKNSIGDGHKGAVSMNINMLETAEDYLKHININDDKAKQRFNHALYTVKERMERNKENINQKRQWREKALKRAKEMRQILKLKQEQRQASLPPTLSVPFEMHQNNFSSRLINIEKHDINESSLQSGFEGAKMSTVEKAIIQNKQRQQGQINKNKAKRRGKIALNKLNEEKFKNDMDDALNRYEKMERQQRMVNILRNIQCADNDSTSNNNKSEAKSNNVKSYEQEFLNSKFEKLVPEVVDFNNFKDKSDDENTWPKDINEDWYVEYLAPSNVINDDETISNLEEKTDDHHHRSIHISGSSGSNSEREDDIEDQNNEELKEDNEKKDINVNFIQQQQLSDNNNNNNSNKLEKEVGKEKTRTNEELIDSKLFASDLDLQNSSEIKGDLELESLSDLNLPKFESMNNNNNSNMNNNNNNNNNNSHINNNSNKVNDRVDLIRQDNEKLKELESVLDEMIKFQWKNVSTRLDEDGIIDPEATIASYKQEKQYYNKQFEKKESDLDENNNLDVLNREVQQAVSHALSDNIITDYFINRKKATKINSPNLSFGERSVSPTLVPIPLSDISAPSESERSKLNSNDTTNKDFGTKLENNNDNNNNNNNTLPLNEYYQAKKQQVLSQLNEENISINNELSKELTLAEMFKKKRQLVIDRIQKRKKETEAIKKQNENKLKFTDKKVSKFGGNNKRKNVDIESRHSKTGKTLSKEFGKKRQISIMEMKERAKRNYSKLPEVQQRDKSNNHKQLIRKRLERAKQFSERIKNRNLSKK